MPKSKLTVAAEISQLLQIPAAVLVAYLFQQSGAANPMTGTLIAFGLIMALAAGLNVFAVAWSHRLNRVVSEKDFVFFEGRKRRVSLEDLFKNGGPINVITHVGGTLANLQMLEGNSLVDRLILQDPHGQELPLLAKGVEDRSESLLRHQIKITLGATTSKTRLFDAPLSSVIIGRVGNGRGWAHVEVFLPRVPATDRPSFFFRESAYPKAFISLEKMFDETWKAAREPREQDKVLPS